ncbi:uncharacterized protein LOC131927191 isoform X1 [Physella acuta]|uniref:uncharacterized protein LOC131927191 isoform X1 n=1 Tax=Physella acuta TaxID=109671 RepID=UPI0027DDC6CD|nr:uncharacterized protein LOC131927191 isoform X1 [Physella acuta]
MFRLVLVLSLCYIAAECGHVKRGGCDSVLACSSPLESVGPDNVDNLSDEAAYEEFCQKATAFSSCFSLAEGECDNSELKNNVRGQVNMADFLCSDETKDDISALADSECAKNELKMVEVQQGVEGCMMSFQNELQFAFISAMLSGQDASAVNFCPLVDQLSVCVINKATESCGSSVGGFLSRMWNVATGPSFEQLGCGNQARNARRSIETIVPLLAKAAKRRR